MRSDDIGKLRFQVFLNYLASGCIYWDPRLLPILSSVFPIQVSQHGLN